MCPPVLYRPAPRLDPLLRGLRNAMCVKVYGRVLKAPPLFPEMKFCITCYPGIFHRHQVKPFWQHEFCDGPFTMEHCRVCRKVITTVRPIQNCDKCFPMYIRVYNVMKEENLNKSELLILHYDIIAHHVIKLHFITYPFIDDETLPNLVEDRDNMLEPVISTCNYIIL